MLSKLRGMFAFAIWDEKRRKLLVARDPYGKKPLVYWQNADGFRFASELKSLLREPGFPKDVDHEAIDDYLMYQYIPHPKTIFQGRAETAAGQFRRLSRTESSASKNTGGRLTNTKRRLPRKTPSRRSARR